MKTKITQLCILFFVLFQMQLQAQNSTSFTTLEDTYVVKGNPTTNYGSAADLQIKGSTGGANNRKGYLKFDLSLGNASDEQIVLRVVKSAGEELKLTAQSTTSIWDEMTMFWNNAPAGLEEAGQDYLRQGEEIFIDITDFVKSKIASSEYVISLILSSNDIIGSPFKVYSKENGDATKQPKIIFYKTKEIVFPIQSSPITLSKYVSSNMVIQRGKAFPFIGQGDVGETINVSFLREGVTTNASGIVDAQGNFSISIPAMVATANGCTATISVMGKPEKTITLTNILIGDVWYAGGQSNMEKKVDYLLEATTVIADANNFKNIRAFRAEYNAIGSPTDIVKPKNASWIVCDSDNVSKTSAVAYIFAKKIYQATGIPIGLMQAYTGGTEIETWISQDKIQNDKKLQFLKERLPNYNPNDSNYYQVYPSVNYNGMVNPLRFFPIKGFLFYQGESNTKRAPEYAILMKALIQDYRAKWNLGNLPFYFVQLPNYGIASNRNYEVTSDDNTWQMIRQQQLMVYQNSGLPNLGMAVVIETNEEHLNSDQNIRIHPHNKMPVGDRLSKIALKEQYGVDVVAYSPLVEKTWIEGKKVFIQMKNVGTGLKIRSNESALLGFAIGNQSGIYYDATATIAGSNLISVESNSVTAPAYIAYGWSRDPICTLDNSANLPASPFRMALNPTKEIQIIEDSFIKNGSQSGTNFGNSTELKVMNDGSNQSQTFLKIDLSNLLFTPIQNARLRITANASDIMSIAAYSIIGNWKENEITWNNAPQINQQIGSIAISNGATSYDLDITTAIQAAIANEDLTLTIVLQTTNGSANFYSNQNTLNKPIVLLNDDSGFLSTKSFANADDNFIVFPNPVNDFILNIQTKNNKQGPSKISLINLVGQSFSFPNISQGSEQQLDLSTFSAGVYFLQIEAANKQFQKKIIIP